MLLPPDMLPDDDVVRLVIEIGAQDALLLERYAAFRNALAVVEGRRLKRKGTRKSMAEWYVGQACLALREQLQEMVAALGELPDAADEDAALEYARKASAWGKRTAKR